MTDTTASPTVLQQIPLDQIVPSSHQARKQFDEEALKGLAESMKQEGLMQPVVVRKIEGMKGREGEAANLKQDVSPHLPIADTPTPTFELISGERRLRAAKLLGWATIEAKVIVTVSEGEAAAKGLIENLQREDLNPIEEAEGFAELSRVDPNYWTQDQIGKVTGKNRTYVTRSLGILALPEFIKEDVRHRTLTRNHAIELCRLPNPDLQLNLARRIPDRLTVMETRNLVDSILGGKNKAKMKKKLPREELDPIAQVWLQAEAFLPPGAPEPTIHYTDKKWVLEIPDTFRNPKTDMARYLSGLGEGVAKALDKIPKAPIQLPDDLKKQAQEAKDLKRIPQTPEEWQELEALAKGSDSPKAAYTWLYGEDSPVIQRLGGTTWKDLEINDPVNAVHDLVETVQLLK